MTEQTQIAVSGSLTTEFYDRLVNTMIGVTPQIAQVVRVVFVDVYGNERDSTTSLTYSIEAGKLKITCSITASASYQLKLIRTYDANQAIVSETQYQIPISAGVTYDVIIYIDLSFQPASGYSFSMLSLKQITYDILRGLLPPSRLKIAYVGIQIYIYSEGTSYVYDAEPTLTKISSTQLRIDAYRTIQGGIGCLEGFLVRTPDLTNMYVYFLTTCQDIPVTSYVTYSETLLFG